MHNANGNMTRDANKRIGVIKYNLLNLPDQVVGEKVYATSSPLVGRFTSMDPLCEHDYSVSPYAYCGNNPLSRIDPSGRKWKTTRDEKIAGNLQDDIFGRQETLLDKIRKINEEVAKVSNHTGLSEGSRSRKLDKLKSQLSDYETQHSILSGVSNGIRQLGSSENVYTFNTADPKQLALSSEVDGTVVINNDGTTGNRVHETVHAIQYDKGEINFRPLGSNNIVFIEHPMKVEIEAYRAQYSLTRILPPSAKRTPRNIFGVNLDWVRGIKDLDGFSPYSPVNYK